MEYKYIIMKHWKEERKKNIMGIQTAKQNLENNIKYTWHEVWETFTPVFRYKREILRQMILVQPILSVHGHTLITTHLPHIIKVIECRDWSLP